MHPRRGICAAMGKRACEIARCLERAIADDFGRCLHEAFIDRLAKERQPALEKRARQLAELPMCDEHITMIAALHAQGGAPEFAHFGDMCIPVSSQGLLEDRREQGVATNLGIKAIYQHADRLLREAVVFHGAVTAKRAPAVPPWSLMRPRA